MSDRREDLQKLLERLETERDELKLKLGLAKLKYHRPTQGYREMSFDDPQNNELSAARQRKKAQA